MDSLEAVEQHGTIFFIHDVSADLDDACRGDAEEVAIKRGVVEFAQREPVAHRRNAARVAVSNDMSRIEKLAMAEPAHGTGVSIGTKDALAEGRLVKSLKHYAGAVASDWFFGHCQ